MAKVRLNTNLLKALPNVLFMPALEIRDVTGIAKSTWYDIMAKPDAITIQYLLAIANGLHVPVRRFFSTGRTDIIGKHDDYVTEAYKECHYDGALLTEIINSRPDTTWTKAGKTADMTYHHVQKSLSAKTRTPVSRFLDVCEAFDIDPFTILIDPNPEPRKQGGKRKGTTATEEEALRKDIQDLTAAVADLTGKYQDITAKYDSLAAKYNDLLSAHRALARRVSVNIENVSSSYIGIAADAAPDK